jgi:hypothetical protein
MVTYLLQPLDSYGFSLMDDMVDLCIYGVIDYEEDYELANLRNCYFFFGLGLF